MAKINGIEVKALKKFSGHDGEPLLQGNIYVSGKKVAFWSQDYHGAICDNVCMEAGYDEDKLCKIMKESDADIDTTYEYMHLTFFMHELSCLQEYENAFKKAIKNGWSALCVVKASGVEYVSKIGKELASLPDEQLKKEFADEIQEAKRYSRMETEPRFTVYRTLDDFIIGKPFDVNQIKCN